MSGFSRTGRAVGSFAFNLFRIECAARRIFQQPVCDAVEHVAPGEDGLMNDRQLGRWNRTGIIESVRYPITKSPDHQITRSSNHPMQETQADQGREPCGPDDSGSIANIRSRSGSRSSFAAAFMIDRSAPVRLEERRPLLWGE